MHEEQDLAVLVDQRTVDPGTTPQERIQVVSEDTTTNMADIETKVHTSESLTLLQAHILPRRGRGATKGVGMSHLDHD